MMDTVSKSIQAVMDGKLTFCKFLSANDTGQTGGHQAGIYISKPAIPILFTDPGKKGFRTEPKFLFLQFVACISVMYQTNDI